MNRRFDNKVTRRRSRRGLVWVFGVVALVAGLLYWEQVEIIYVLSVLSLCAFLVVVAFSDLDRRAVKAGVSTPQEGDEAAAVGVVGGTAEVTPTVARRRDPRRRRRSAA